MKSILLSAFLFCAFQLVSQEKTPDDWGLTQIPFTFEGVFRVKLG